MLDKLMLWRRKASLHHAVLVGNLDVVVECLYKCSTKSVNKRDRDGFTALHFAALYDHREIVRLLLERGADADCADKMGRTPLHVASARGHHEVVQMLVRSGAQVKLRDKAGLKSVDVICNYVLDKRRANAIRGLLSLAELRSEKQRFRNEQEWASLDSILACRLDLCDPCVARNTPKRCTSLPGVANTASTARSGLTPSPSLPRTCCAYWETDEEAYGEDNLLASNSRDTALHLIEPLAGREGTDDFAASRVSRRSFSSTEGR
ncbi:hypothetical protein BSKO_03605 [Bryopsis sp. KO-2023]|nr:hypothetical protein BSKO_03605 [Bryopsis sp. KO-2023]